MRFFAPALLATVVSAAAVIKRDAQTVINDIAAISSGVDKVQADVDNFQGGPNGLFQALPLLTDSTNLNNAIQQGARDAEASQPFNDDDSFAIAGAVLDLQPKIDTVLDSLIQKRPNFDGLIFGFSGAPIVLGTLNQLRNSTTDFGAKTVEKLTPDVAAIAPSVLGEIDAKFAEAIAAYQ